MIITHTEYFAFPNTPEGRSYAEIAESGFRLRPTVLEVMREPNDKEVRDA